ncbi:MAG: GNAT family N-acetyltransferase [Gammaproteobacteria bacterium]|nr:GNAT family N-acetyltransferase [Gammaproteobacteria bacterium]
MTDPVINICPANKEDLDDINRVIEAAIMCWDLPERVKRLSLPSYFYNEQDLQHLEIVVIKQNKDIIGLASWHQAENKDTPENKTALLLHGLYIHPNNQNLGIGKQLLKTAERAALDKELNGILVKAHADAINYFIKQGMIELKIQNASRDYAHRLWKVISE